MRQIRQTVDSHLPCILARLPRRPSGCWGWRCWASTDVHSLCGKSAFPRQWREMHKSDAGFDSIKMLHFHQDSKGHDFRTTKKNGPPTCGPFFAIWLSYIIYIVAWVNFLWIAQRRICVCFPFKSCCWVKPFCDWLLLQLHMAGYKHRQPHSPLCNQLSIENIHTGLFSAHKWHSESTGVQSTLIVIPWCSIKTNNG